MPPLTGQKTSLGVCPSRLVHGMAPRRSERALRVVRLTTCLSFPYEARPLPRGENVADRGRDEKTISDIVTIGFIFAVIMGGLELDDRIEAIGFADSGIGIIPPTDSDMSNPGLANDGRRPSGAPDRHTAMIGSSLHDCRRDEHGIGGWCEAGLGTRSAARGRGRARGGGGGEPGPAQTRGGRERVRLVVAEGRTDGIRIIGATTPRT